MQFRGLGVTYTSNFHYTGSVLTHSLLYSVFFVCCTGYWPSYNIPFYEEIYNMSGYPSVVDKHGPGFSYQLAPRAKIFRRDQARVVDMETLKDIMRYNGIKGV